MDSLFQAGRADMEAKETGVGTPLHLAIQGHKIKIVRFLLEIGVDVNARGPEGNTALHFAVKNKLDGILEVLMFR